MRQRGRGGQAGGGSLRRLMCRLLAPDPDSDDEVTCDWPVDLASPRARLFAAGLDLTLMAVVLYSLGALGHDPAAPGRGSPLLIAARVLVWVSVLAAPALLEGSAGQTPGKRRVGIRVVSLETGGPIKYRTAAHRAAARALFWPISFLALTDPLRQTLPDRSAGTVVINAIV